MSDTLYGVLFVEQWKPDQKPIFVDQAVFVIGKSTIARRMTSAADAGIGVGTVRRILLE